jgi:hypothetical protein
MIIKQISVFVEKQPGRLAEITSVIANEHIDMRALSIADNHAFRNPANHCDDPERAEKILKAAGLTVSLTDVIAINISDTPGGLAQALKVLSEKEIAVEYMYAFVAKTGGAFAVLRTDNSEGGVEALTASGFAPFSISDV